MFWKDSCCCDEKKRRRRYVLYGVGGFIIAFLLVIILFWAITRPTKPGFALQDATLYSFNLSSPPSQPITLSASMQVTISTTNRMDKIGIYYKDLDVYASYRNQRITLSTMLPSTYLGHKETTVWSPFLNSNSVPASQYVADSLAQDLNAGTVLLYIKVKGTVKWKLGAFISGGYPLIVNCPAYISYSEKSRSIAPGESMKLQIDKSCFVDV